MKRVAVFIDGYNIYHAIDDDPSCHKYKWLDFDKLSRLMITKSDSIEKIYYFTALATWMPDKVARHKILIKALEIKNIEIVYGEFKNKDRFCKNCHTIYKSHEEKQTDVNIAIYLFKLAVEDAFDTALIISGDSDLIPAIKAFKSTFLNKRVGVIIPFGRNADQLKQTCDFHQRMKRKHLDQCILPDVIDLGNGQSLKCPDNWR